MGTPTHVEEGHYVTVEDYALQIGISTATVKRRCARGDLVARKVGKAWLIRVGKGFGS